jgi:predicted GIY-YIG superfamily endonuclease
MFTVYVLKSLSVAKCYVGYTSDLEKRRIIIPDFQNTPPVTVQKLIYKEEFSGRSEAMKREKYFKSYEGRKWLYQNILQAETNPNSD